MTLTCFRRQLHSQIFYIRNSNDLARDLVDKLKNIPNVSVTCIRNCKRPSEFRDERNGILDSGLPSTWRDLAQERKPRPRWGLGRRTDQPSTSMSSTGGDGGTGPATRRARSATTGPRVRALAERVESKTRTERAPVVKETKRPSRSRTPANPRGGDKTAAQDVETSMNAPQPNFQSPRR